LNDSPLFIQALAAIVTERLGEKSETQPSERVN
jgi:hypothetical protein